MKHSSNYGESLPCQYIRQAAGCGVDPPEIPDTVLEFCLSHGMGVVVDTCHCSQEVEAGRSEIRFLKSVGISEKANR